MMFWPNMIQATVQYSYPKNRCCVHLVTAVLRWGLQVPAPQESIYLRQSMVSIPGWPLHSSPPVMIAILEPQQNVIVVSATQMPKATALHVMALWPMLLRPLRQTHRVFPGKLSLNVHHQAAIAARSLRLIPALHSIAMLSATEEYTVQAVMAVRTQWFLQISQAITIRLCSTKQKLYHWVIAGIAMMVSVVAAITSRGNIMAEPLPVMYATPVFLMRETRQNGHTNFNGSISSYRI